MALIKASIYLTQDGEERVKILSAWKQMQGGMKIV